MKLIVFGPTGGIGRELVTQALELGYAVTVFTRSPEKLDPLQEKIRLVKGDVLDLGAVKRAIQGQDAVFCALGTPVMDNTKLRANGTANIIDAMDRTGVKRLVCVSALGVDDSRALLPLHYRYLIIPLMMGRLYADHALQEHYIKESRLDWVIVRPGSYMDGERTSAYRHGLTAADKPIKAKISRADVAEFMLRQLADGTYVRKTPCISY